MCSSDLGLPIGTLTSTPPTGGTLGKADTVVIRLDDVTTSGGITNIEVVGLSLQSEASANIPGLPWSATDSTDIFVGLQKYYTGTGTCGSANCPSPGTIKMYEDSGALKFDASFTIRDVVILAKAGSLLPTGTDYVKDLIDACSHVPSPAYLCVPDTFTIGVTGARWQSSPGKDFLLGDNLKNPGVATNFFLSDLTQLKSTSTNPTTGLPNKIHGVVPTPAPLPFLGASTAYAFARRLRKRCRQAASA